MAHQHKIVQQIAPRTTTCFTSLSSDICPSQAWRYAGSMRILFRSPTSSVADLTHHARLVLHGSAATQPRIHPPSEASPRLFIRSALLHMRCVFFQLHLLLVASNYSFLNRLTRHQQNHTIIEINKTQRLQIYMLMAFQYLWITSGRRWTIPVRPILKRTCKWSHFHHPAAQHLTSTVYLIASEKSKVYTESLEKRMIKFASPWDQPTIRICGRVLSYRDYIR